MAASTSQAHQERTRPLPDTKNTNDIVWSPSSLVSCPHCMEAVQQSQLKIHISQLHGKTMPYTCDICYRGYLSHAGLICHMDVHKGKNVICSICEKRFFRNYHLKRHMKMVHKSAQCSKCSTVLLAGPEYNLHLLYCNK